MDTARTRRENEVWQACDDLWTQGLALQKISLETITARLLELGFKKGSPNQIYDYRKTWKHSRGIADDNLIPSTALTSTDPISRAVNLVREELQTEAEQRITQIREEADMQVAEVKEQHDLLKTQLHDIVSRLEQKETLLATTEQSNLALKNTLQRTEQAYQQEKLKAETHERFLQQLRQDTQTQCTQLEKSYQDKLNQSTVQFNQLIQHQREEISELKNHLENQRHQWLAERDKLKTTHQHLEQDLVQVRSREDNLTQRNNELYEQVQQQIKNRAFLQADYDSVKMRLTHTEKNTAIKEKENDYLQSQVIEKEQVLKNKEQQLLFANEQIRKLEDIMTQLVKNNEIIEAKEKLSVTPEE